MIEVRYILQKGIFLYRECDTDLITLSIIGLFGQYTSENDVVFVCGCISISKYKHIAETGSVLSL